MRARRLLHLVARRGNCAEFPDNTLPAVRSAIELGARFIEIDVHLSADGVPMIAHDRQLAVVPGVEQMSATQLAALDVSQAERFGERFRGTCLASLAATLGLLDRRPEVTAFVMIGRVSVARFGHELVAAQVNQALKPFRSRCVLASMDLPTLHAARAMAGYPIAWVVPANDAHTRLKYEALQPEFLFCDRAYLPAQGALWRGPWRWVIYEVDSLDAVLEVGAAGADFVVTRNFRRLSAAMHTHAAEDAQPSSDGLSSSC